jgi:hypothetical protein
MYGNYCRVLLLRKVTGTPGHVNSMAESVLHFMEHFPLETMAEGDVFTTNDPWLATGHLWDFMVAYPFKPAFVPLSYSGDPGVNGVSHMGWRVSCRWSLRRLWVAGSSAHWHARHTSST